MTGRQIVGGLLTAIGLIALLWGGFFRTDRETVIDAGPLEVQTAEREGINVPAIVAGVILVSGVILLAVPSRRRA
jgi:hypothetical protein